MQREKLYNLYKKVYGNYCQDEENFCDQFWQYSEYGPSKLCPF